MITKPTGNDPQKPLSLSAQNPVEGDAGFTLIETMLALFTFTIGILAVMTMTVSAFESFSRSRLSTTEVNRTTVNLEMLKEVGYENSNIFTGAPTTPIGSDSANVGFEDRDDAVVWETKLIVIRNTELKGVGAAGEYELYYTKPMIE